MRFNLSINGGFHADIGEEFQEEDIIKLLSFDENDIEPLLKTHAAIQVYWEALAIKYRNRYESYKEDWAKKWWAYNRTYAKYVLAAYGEKTSTVEAIKDTTILIYSSDTSDAERTKYAALAFQIASRNKAFFEGSEKDFYNLMFKYLLVDPAWYFETVVGTLTSFKEQYELVENVAEKMNSRSFHMQSLLQLLSAKQYNIGPKSISDGQIANQINSRRTK